MRLRIGVDSGGTFTDLCLFEEESGRIGVTKVPSTPADPSIAILQGIADLLDREGCDASQVSYLGHGTTVATNALIQHAGARTGLITTQGFRDLLELGRQRRPDLYDLQADKPVPLVPRDLRLEVPERTMWDGRVERPLDKDAVAEAARTLKARGVEAVAVCFLYSYLNPDHERQVKAILQRELPGAYVSTSHEVLPEFREYERLSTVTINAYLGPVMAEYIRNLEQRLAEMGIRAGAYLTQSNGGVISLQAARDHAVRTVLSGPSAGVVGGSYVGELAGIADVITFDMGGTSTDVSLVEKGRLKVSGEMEVQGYPIRVPMVEVNTVGAGGGSVAWIDAGGHPKVGPRSAGAEPGPACYGRGNDEPTVTDANVVLQILNPEHLLGGRMRIDAAAAHRAVGRLAGRLGLDPMDAAQGILSLVTSNMARAIRVVSVRKGHDPRDFTLVAFGGAGPLHAARLARELGIPRVLVPEAPGILCALGLLVTDMRSDYTLTRILAADGADPAEITGLFTTLEAQADRWLTREGVAPQDRLFRRSVDMRYRGQNYELQVQVPDGALGPAELTDLIRRFHRLHEHTYGYAAQEEPAQLVTFRLEALGRVPRATLSRDTTNATDGQPTPLGTRKVFLEEVRGLVECPVYRRQSLQTGHRIPGPAIVEQMDSTTLILPDQAATVDPFRNLLIQVFGGSEASGG